ncbi:MAG: GNAT family N-acetyltransferase [Candidatus Krumholzibacteria bacterium]|nr:GNAT family N-acetyltransferase [Candidatus Krumholzibacteria bacterium]
MNRSQDANVARTGKAKPVISYRTFQSGDEAGVVAVLNAAYPTPWGTLEQWRAKHGGRRGFRPEEIFVAECDGRIVGCLHTAVRPVRIGPGVQVRQSFDGDLAVHPDFRGLQIPEELYRRSSELYYEQGIELRGGFTSPRLWSRFYQPRIGYVAGFDRTRPFNKQLSSSKLCQGLLQILGDAQPADPEAEAAVVGESGDEDRMAPKSIGPTLELRIKDIEPIRLRLVDRGAFVLDPADDLGRALTLYADQTIFGTGSGALGQAKNLIRLILARRIRVRGVLTSGPAVLSWLFHHRRVLLQRLRRPRS